VLFVTNKGLIFYSVAQRVTGMEKIGLRRVTIDEYVQFEAYWGDNRKIREGQEVCSVINPVIAQTYDGAVEQMVSLPHVFKINVRDPRDGHWERFYASDLQRDNVRGRAAMYARKQQRKHHYFEAELRRPGQGFEDAAVIEFAETPNGLIVGYKVRVKNANYALFDVDFSTTKLTINGLVDPRYLAGIRTAREGMHRRPGGQRIVHTG